MITAGQVWTGGLARPGGRSVWLAASCLFHLFILAAFGLASLWIDLERVHSMRPVLQVRILGEVASPPPAPPALKPVPRPIPPPPRESLRAAPLPPPRPAPTATLPPEATPSAESRPESGAPAVPAVAKADPAESKGREERRGGPPGGGPDARRAEGPMAPTRPVGDDRPAAPPGKSEAVQQAPVEAELPTSSPPGADPSRELPASRVSLAHARSDGGGLGGGGRGGREAGSGAAGGGQGAAGTDAAGGGGRGGGARSAASAGGAGSDRTSVTEILATIRRRIQEAKTYPEAIRRQGLQGTVEVALQIGPDGSPQTVKVVQSSGHPQLDELSLQAVRRGAPYPVLRGRITIPIIYRVDP